MEEVKFCKNCRNKTDDNGHIEDAYMPWLYDKDFECPVCKQPIVNTIITVDEYMVISEISDTLKFFEAMLQLKQNDIIEYESRMGQFKNQIEQRKQKPTQSSNQPKCPHCSSTKIAKISGTERAGSILMWGIFSKKINKSFKCNNCGYTW